MSIPYDEFTNAFLSKITEYDFVGMRDYERTALIDGYMKRAIANFKKNCLYDLTTTGDDNTREFDLDIEEEDLDELVEIISEGMVVQWLKPFTHKQDNLEHSLNTDDFTGYSPAELLLRIRNEYDQSRKNYTAMVREYSYNHADLTELHS